MKAGAAPRSVERLQCLQKGHHVLKSLAELDSANITVEYDNLNLEAIAAVKADPRRHMVLARAAVQRRA